LFRFPFSVAVGAGVLFANGCSASDAPPKSMQISVPNASPRSATVSDSASSDPDPKTRDNDPVSAFLTQDGFAGDIVAERSLVDFLADNLAAQMDRDLSRPDFGYVVYRDAGRVYEFLDEKLFGVRFVEPLSSRNADNKIVPYLKTLGDPTNKEMPRDLREAKATKFLSWDLPAQKLRINFAYLPTRNSDADLELFGQVFNRDVAEEFLARRSDAASVEPSEKTTKRGKAKSISRQRIEELIADSEWGKVAATVDRLCAGSLSDEESHVQILKTLNLARGGHFSPKFTLQALQQAEVSAVKNQLSPIQAVRACQQSLAFGAAAADQKSQK
jgi:hypothetical protein